MYSCFICGWNPDSYVRFLAPIVIEAARQLGKNVVGLVVPCAECLPPVVIQHTWVFDV